MLQLKQHCKCGKIYFRTYSYVAVFEYLICPYCGVHPCTVTEKVELISIKDNPRPIDINEWIGI